MTPTFVYLASQSPRRRELLAQIGVRYKVLKVDVEEVRQHTETPDEYVLRLAKDKARAGVQCLQDGEQYDAPVLGADTIVVAGGVVLEKPTDKSDAIDMLLRLSGRRHQVMTAVAIADADRCRQVLSVTEVSFRDISLEEAEGYWLTGEPQDKAGGYGIQGLGAVFVTSLNGSYSAVVGLPLEETSQLLYEYSVPIWHKA